MIPKIRGMPLLHQKGRINLSNREDLNVINTFMYINTKPDVAFITYNNFNHMDSNGIHFHGVNDP